MEFDAPASDRLISMLADPFCIACRGDALAIQNVLGALLVADIFLGTNNASTVQPVVDVERAVMYRCGRLFWGKCTMSLLLGASC